MKLLSILSLLLVFGFAACGDGAPTSASDGAFAKNDNVQTHDILWNLNATFQNALPTCSGATLTNLVTSTGTNTLSHLGNTTGSGAACVWRSAPLGGNVSGEDLTLVAANGDRVYFDIVGTFTIDISELPKLTFNHTGTYEIAGGTGRFAYARGAGDYTAVNVYANSSATTGPLSFEFDGTLIY